MMAVWHVGTGPVRITVTYTGRAGLPFNCGDQHPDTDVGLILDWIAHESASGDVAYLDGRPVFQKLRPVAA